MKISKQILSKSLIDRDFEDIEKEVMSPGAWEEGRVMPEKTCAPPVGNPFLTKAKPIKKILKRFSLTYSS